jgi:3-dehydroquinate synthase
MDPLIVKSQAGPYPVHIGENALKEHAGALAQACPSKRAIIVTDSNVGPLHAGALASLLGSQGVEASVHTVPAGESSKSLGRAQELYSAVHKAGVQRSGTVIALGGGVVGDLAGFAAATWLRGVALAQVPTTLLSQVDSSVGGKVAVNLPEGKNLVGAFYPPKLVVVDTAYLQTLPERELRAGMGEVVKYAAIGPEAFFARLEEAGEGGQGGKIGPSGLNDVIRHCCETKAAYVEADERDTGERMMLNFGHTFGHAIEKLCGYGRFAHGEAVAAGMRLALEAGEKLGVTDKGAADRVIALMEKLGLGSGPGQPLALGLDPRELIPHMRSDKKNQGNGIRLVLLESIGRPVVRETSEEALYAAL